MIQRIQTIYMLASAIAIAMMFFFPLATIQIPEATFKLSAFGLTSITPNMPYDLMRWSLLLAIVILFALPLVCIFLYKKLHVQLRIMIFTAVLDAMFYLQFYFAEIKVAEALATFESNTGECISNSGLIPAIMPAISLFCCIMAIKGILYDIALLSSANRLRSRLRK